jgi:hypothetical protein
MTSYLRRRVWWWYLPLAVAVCIAPVFDGGYVFVPASSANWIDGVFKRSSTR